MHRYTIAIDGRSFQIDVDEEAADRFRVAVDGQAFEVTLGAAEELVGTEPAAAGVAVQRVASAPARKSAPPGTAGPSTPSGPPGAPSASHAGHAGLTLAAPMPGVILRLSVSVGSAVVRGQDIAVLEAMKMENVLRAAQPGVIAEVCVAPGAQVVHGQAIVRFEAGAR